MFYFFNPTLILLIYFFIFTFHTSLLYSSILYWMAQCKVCNSFLRGYAFNPAVYRWLKIQFPLASLEFIWIYIQPGLKKIATLFSPNFLVMKVVYSTSFTIRNKLIMAMVGILSSSDDVELILLLELIWVFLNQIYGRKTVEVMFFFWKLSPHVFF